MGKQKHMHSILSSAKKHPQTTLFLVTTTLMFMPFYISVPAFLFATLYLITKHYKTILTDYKKLGWIGVFIIYAIVISMYNKNTIGIAVGVFLIFFAYYFKYYRDWIDGVNLLRLLQLIVFSSWWLSVLSIIKYIRYAYANGYDVWYVFKYANVQIRAEATFFNANYYGLFCIFSILIAMYLFTRIKWRIVRIMYCIIILHNVISILLTASRMLLPTLFISIIWFLLFVDRRWAFVALIGAAAVTGMLIIRPDLMPRLETISYGFQDRFLIWETGWRVFKSSPWIGRGLMSYLSFYYQFTNKAQLHSHNLYLDALANFGIIGCILLLITLTHFLRQLVSLIRYEQYRLEIGLVSAFVLTVLVHGTVDVAIFWIQTGYIFLLLTVPKPLVLCELSRLPLQKVHSISSLFFYAE